MPASPLAQPNPHGPHADFESSYEAGLAAAGVDEAPARRARFYHLVQMLRLTRGLDGDTAEAGCYRGLSSHLICSERRREDPAFDGSTHAMFDSFEGFAPPAPEDGDYSVRRYRDGAFTTTSVEHVRAALGEFPAVRVHRGWIPEVFAPEGERRYRFVHIDVDLHDPTLASLEFFFPRLLPGGIAVVDDYGPWPNGAYPGCAVAVRRFAQRHGLPVAVLNTGNAVLVKR